MLTEFHPYITFNGSCKDALEFYRSCFGGQIEFIQYYGELTQNSSSSRVMHSEFRSGEIQFMACDTLPDEKIIQGTNISLYVSFSDADKQNETFARLAEEGNVHMNLEKTYWGSRLGILTDRFGIHWMLVLNDPDKPIEESRE
jgi:PhnB protein